MRGGRFLAVNSVFAVIAIAVGFLFSSAVECSGACEGFSVLPPHSELHGRTLAQWGAEWWKWALSIISRRPTG